MREKPVIVFAPHPDDETLGCGGTIAKRISEGYEVLVVIMTDGKFGLKILGVDSDPTPEELKEIRRKEVQRALKVLDVPEKNLFCLDFEDNSLESNRKSVEAKVWAILEKDPPAEVYFTSSEDQHPDHRATNWIVLDALKKSGFEVVKYQYSINKGGNITSRIKDSFRKLLKHDTVYVDISKYLDLKKSALNEFKSQITIMSSKQKEPALSLLFIRNHLKDHEVFDRG
jgi:LmbE family N-acetylglucosaminyl deacetylase